MTFDHWCHILKDETEEENASGGASHEGSLGNSIHLGRSVSGGKDGGSSHATNSPTSASLAGGNSPRSPEKQNIVRSRGSSRIGGFPGISLSSK